MTDYTSGIVIEARKKGLRQSRDAKGDWYDVTFQIHPDDAISDLAKLPLGARVGLVITLLQDTETPADEHSTPEATETPEEPARPKGGAKAMKAGILCNAPAFQSHLQRTFGWSWTSIAQADYDSIDQIAAEVVRDECGVESRAELDHNEDAARIFDQIVADFEAVQRGETPEELARQAAEGPR